MIEQLKEIENELFKTLIPKTSITANRRGFPTGHRRMVMGVTRGRFNGKIGLSNHSTKYPVLYKLIFDFGKKYIPFEFNAVHINHNVICPKHLDSKNIGISAIVSVGNYTGCKLMIENVECDPYYNIVMFNGSEREHWNTDDLVGDRYSIVFYHNGLIPNTNIG